MSRQLLCLACSLLWVWAMPEVRAAVPVETTTIKSGGTIAVNVYAPPKDKSDGRVVLLLHGGTWAAHPKDYDVAKQADSLVARGCVVVAADLSALPDRSRGVGLKAYEQMWRLGSPHAGEKPRLIAMPAGFDLADPIPFIKLEKETVSLDLVFPVAGEPRPTLIRIYSGTFGLERAYDMAIAGFAQAVVRDPRNELKLPPQVCAQYGAAAARALRANAARCRLGDKVGIFGLSKHGFCAGLIGAQNATVELEAQPMNADASGRINAVGMFTDSYDVPTRAEDFKAAGHAWDAGPDDATDIAGSPARLVGKGAPAFLLTDAHNRPSRQYVRMIEALQKFDVPFQQCWDEKQPNYVPKSSESMRRFLAEHLK